MSHDCPTGNHRTSVYSCYNNCGCRCAGCTEMAARYNKRRQARIHCELERVRAERPPLKPAPLLDYVAVPFLDLPWYDDRPAS